MTELQKTALEAVIAANILFGIWAMVGIAFWFYPASAGFSFA